MNNKIFKAFCVVAVLAFNGNVMATVVGSYNTTELLRQSNTVVIGKIVGATLAGGQDADVLILQAERTLKSNVPVEIGSRLRVAIHAPIVSAIAPGSHGLFLINCGTDPAEVCVPVRPVEPCFPALDGPGAALTGANEEAIQKAVAAELAAVISAGDNTLSSAANDALSSDDAVQVRMKVISALETLPLPIARQAIAEVGRPTNIPIRLALVTADIDLGDLSSIPSVRTDMMSDDPTYESARREVAFALRGVKNPTQVLTATMAEWVRSTDPFVREAAAYTLRQIGTPEVVRPLLDIALKDPNWHTRYSAAMGLATVTHEGDSGTVSDFLAAENHYISYWQRNKQRLQAKYK